MKLKFDLSDRYNALLPIVENINESTDELRRNWWKIDQTISELSYLTHGFFRYYGNFPPTIASYLLNKYPCPENGGLLDNFVGSGTSLVEAARRGIPAVGIDINPLACLSGTVKTTLYNTNKLKTEIKENEKLINKTNYKKLRTYLIILITIVSVNSFPILHSSRSGSLKKLLTILLNLKPLY